MYSIKENVESTIIIDKSKFIGNIIPCDNLEDAKKKLADIKKQYYDATHNTYAYIIGENQEYQKYSDDGEPSGTAGLPMLETLKKENLTNILVVVTRYFGGIKLGAGGLVRAYQKSVKESLNIAQYTELKTVRFLTIQVSYTINQLIEKTIQSLSMNYTVSYTENITYELSLLDSQYIEFVNKITNLTNNNYIILADQTKTLFI